MPLSLYESSVSTYVRLLGILSLTVDKAAAHAAVEGYKPGILIDARLFPDMWSFGEQVKAATNHAFRGTARLAGLPIPTMPDAAATFDEIKARIAATVDFVGSVDRAAVEAGDERTITFPMGDKQAVLTGRVYFLSFTLPNFYFHLATAYDILRHNGVPLTKEDFIGGF